MPLQDDQIDNLEDATINNSKKQEIENLLQQNPDKWFYITEISNKVECSHSWAIEIINQMKKDNKIKDKYKEKDNTTHRYVKYNQN